jgi:transposase
MKPSLFVGIDISKATLDVSVMAPSDVSKIQYHQFANNANGFTQLLKWMKQKSNGVQQQHWHVCMENTGMYSLELNCFLHERGIWQCLENALQIKRSMGVLRGKNDKADSKTIALYAYRFSDKLKPYVFPGKVLLRLKALFSQRERLVNIHRQVQLGLQSLKGCDTALIADIKEQSEALLHTLSTQIKELERALAQCLKEDTALQQKAELMQSVPGIGLQTAVYMLIVSRGMQSFDSPRQFACYSGCAPFEHQSGVSVRGKNKVHFFANRKIKSLLHMAALSSIAFNAELKAFYKRKVEAGKNKMSVLNAVRFKLICRIFSVVNRGELYQLNYNKLVA